MFSICGRRLRVELRATHISDEMKSRLRRAFSNAPLSEPAMEFGFSASYTMRCRVSAVVSRSPSSNSMPRIEYRERHVASSSLNGSSTIRCTYESTMRAVSSARSM